MMQREAKGQVSSRSQETSNAEDTDALQNLYKKLKSLKSEFQSVEHRMRKAVEELPEGQRAKKENGDCSKCEDSDYCSSRYSDPDYSCETDSTVSSPGPPLLSPPASLTTTIRGASSQPRHLPFPQYSRGTSSSCSSLSSPTYSSCPSATPDPEDYSSDSTQRSSSSSKTYTQIPVVIRGGSHKIEVSA